MKEIQANNAAWSLLAKEHYSKFKTLLEENTSIINEIITEELGDVKGKSIIHLQCNTGADTISLARLGAKVTGVDFSKENIKYASKLANDFNIEAEFIESDIMTFMDIHSEKYDIVFTSEGVLGWLPDLDTWAKTVRHLIKDDGFFYINESHPFFMTLDEDAFSQGDTKIKYPYWDKRPDSSDEIGGYATAPKKAKNYFWMYKVSDIINALINNGFALEYFNERDLLGWNTGGFDLVKPGLYQHPKYKGKLPLQFSLKATLR